MANRLRLVSLFAVLAIAAAAFGVLSLRGDDASANVVDGSFSLEVNAPTVVGLGSTFTAVVGVYHDGTEPAYQAVQWKVGFDDDRLSTSTAAITKVPAAPSACTSESVAVDAVNPNPPTGDSVLLGCLSLAGADITYSGDVWNVVFTCHTAGTSILTLETADVPTKTFVSDGANDLPSHTHVNGQPSSSVTCIPTADVVTSKTGDSTVNAGDPLLHVITAVNNGPQPWTGAVVADDFPTSGTNVSTACTVGPPTPSGCAVMNIDADGDTTFEITGHPACIYFPVTPGAPPAGGLTDVIACGADLAGVPSIAVNGKLQLVTLPSITASADSCGDTLVDVGSGSSQSAFGGTVTNDPDFLDGVQGNEDNFAPFVVTVGGCPLDITKTGPAGGTTGDAGSYTVTVNNPGPSQATSVTITDNVPAGLTVTSVSPAPQCTNAGNSVTCNVGTIPAGGSFVATINFTMDAPGTYNNCANVTWEQGAPPLDSDQSCYQFTVLPPFNGLVKAVDLNGDTDTADPGEAPGQGEDTINVNLWLCADQATDGIDNDGDSTIDNEDETCTGNGEGVINISELVFTREDCDTRNDDDDGDGEPVSNDPNSPGYRPECPSPTIQDFNNNLVDKDGGELPEGLGALEFQIKFDHKIFDIEVTSVTAWANGRTVNCTMTIVTENDIRFGCVTTANPAAATDGIDNDGDTVVDEPGEGTAGIPQASGQVGATIVVRPEADLVFRIRPTKDNGVVRRILDENCEVADIFGDIFPLTNAGLTPDCTDVTITVRRLEGDTDTDCDVDITDAQRIAFRYGAFFGHLVYDQNYDMEPWPTADFDIDIKDLQFVFGRDGSTCQDPIPDNQDPQSDGGVGQP